MAALHQLRAVAEPGQYAYQVLGVAATGHLADRMHGESGDPDIHGAHPQPARGDGTNGTAAAHVTAHHETLYGDLRLGAQLAEE